MKPFREFALTMLMIAAVMTGLCRLTALAPDGLMPRVFDLMPSRTPSLLPFTATDSTSKEAACLTNIFCSKHWQSAP